MPTPFPVKRPDQAITLVLIFLLSVLAASDSVSAAAKQSDTLWRIVNQCVTSQQQKQTPRPCARVDLSGQPRRSYVMLKDINGVLQYLLLPTKKISGIEAPALLNPQTGNFFALAWQNRDLLSQRYGKPIDDRLLSLTINSKYGRSQNQLHLHLSCTRTDIIHKLWQQYPAMRERWQPVNGGLNHHRYWARKLDRHELARQSPFILLANGLPEAKTRMAYYGLALLPSPDGNFILLTTRVQLFKANLAAIEEIQDHRCPVLYPP